MPCRHKIIFRRCLSNFKPCLRVEIDFEKVEGKEWKLQEHEKTDADLCEKIIYVNKNGEQV